MRIHKFVVVAAAGVGLAATTAHAQTPTYKRDLPDSLLRHAKITEKEAVAIAQKKIPAGTIEAVELEREKGKLIYSFDIKVKGKSGTDEVNVDALTGKVGPLEHESAADEAKEAADEQKAAKKKKP